MHKEILNNNQIELLQFVKLFKREFYLVGGTAIALHIGHRRSIDFDLFKLNALNPSAILKKVNSIKTEYIITRRVTEQLNITVQDVKFTFFQFPFAVNSNCTFEGYLKMPDLLTLAAMKAYAMGRRSKWKDYVDLYFILKEYYTIKQISEKARSIFNDLFSEKQFRAQISYFEDIDYSEEVEYMAAPVNVDDVKAFLVEIATNLF